MTLINPYNFVQLESEEPDRSGYTGRYFLQDNHYSGKLKCTLEALSPLISIDQTGKEEQVKGFLRNSYNEPILQGTSIKGMVRAVYEAMTDSCLALAVTDGTSKKGSTNIKKYAYSDLGKYSNRECNSLKNLCPACRIFGVINGDSLNCQGKVAFSDAVLIGNKLCLQLKYLKELSNPKPHHYATYGENGQKGGRIAGRKFYYQQGANPEYSIGKNKATQRTIAIKECAPVGSAFSFQVSVDNLTDVELGTLLLALELHVGLGHKIGLGKAIGLGSCCIKVDRENSTITTPKERYTNWSSVKTDG